MFLRHLPLLALGAWATQPVAGYVSQARDQEGTCKKTTVAILGAGISGISAAQTLSNASMHDFLILEYRDRIGGRAWHENFGKDKDGKPYVVEMGANWVQGLGNPGGPENPIWTLAKEFGLQTTYSNYSNISTYNRDGYRDYSHLLDEYDEAYDVASPAAGRILTENLQDQTAKAGLALAGWKPKSHDMEAQAVDWWKWDFESAFAPLESSFVFGVASSNLTSNQFSDEDNFVTDQRGFNTIIKGMASKFLTEDDPRLLLNTKITNITYGREGVTVYSSDGNCVQAAYAICTFSLGVLQNDVVTFSPELPEWKKTAIQMFTIGTYTKIFLQFNETFWPTDTQYFLYADPTTRGNYPLFQSLSIDGFHPGSNIIFVTVTNELARRVERQSDEQTKKEIVDVLRNMFPDVDVPEPTDILYPRWSTEPWAYGSYSNWPMGTTLEMHENLRANTDRLWFAGEATSQSYFGFLHGAWFEGRDAGRRISGLLKGCKGRNSTVCGSRKRYPVLHGTSPLADYSFVNGWEVSSFYDSNDD
ncbi:amine oxidase [Aspergillus alliaceus]|uniref:Amine oxidase n=1 Tax=Petromyces alliaceus TaxID=209559 RepID=A0A5N7CPN7_PETAA|nr:amine oxidase [Aspergillus alliaceus]